MKQEPAEKKKPRRQHCNHLSHESWLKRKQAINAARGKQIFVDGTYSRE